MDGEKEESKYMRWNGLLAGFEARSRWVRFPLGAPSLRMRPASKKIQLVIEK
jgi:hypothetical protein